MKRTFLAAAVSAAPFLALGAHAQVQITSATSVPVATATANAGSPANIDITTSGSIGMTTSGDAVTVNSSNTVSNEGAIGFTNLDNSVGILVQGGNTGQVTNTGSIAVTESYVSPADPNNDGLTNGVFAQGTNRIGISVVGASPFTGGITTTGSIVVHGNNSFGIEVAAPITGDLQMLTVTPSATAGATPTVTTGSIATIGDATTGLNVTPTGGVGGNMRLTSVSSTGAGAQAVVIDGAVGGGIDISGTVTSTGYRSTARSSNPALSVLYTAAELEQGGPTVSIGANVGRGLIVSAPPLTLSTTNLDLDGNGVPDAQQGAGQITSFGSAPALQIGAPSSSVTLGEVGSGTNAYGLVVQGGIFASGLFDQVTSPNLPAPASATAVQLGVAGGGALTIDGGVHVTGSITAQAYQANATAIHIGAGATVPAIVNDGSILATATQINTAATGVTPLSVNAIVIDQGATVTSLTNNSGLTADITGTGGVGGSTGAIIDRSGSLANITNTGTISAQITQTLVTAPLPGTLTAIDISASHAAQTLTQQASANQIAASVYNSTLSYPIGAIVSENGQLFQATAAAGVAIDPATTPTVWRQIGATVPSISGSVFFGSGGSNLQVTAGTVSGAIIDLGAGANTVTVNGDVNTAVTGAIRDEGVNTLTLNVVGGTLSDANPTTVQARSVNVGANGRLLISADPVAGTNTKFVTTGASNFAQGAQVGLTLLSLQTVQQQTYIVLQTVPGQGTLTAGTFGSGLLNNSPFLYTATASFAPAANPATDPSEILLTVGRKTPTQLGFNAAEGSALNAVLAALPKNPGIQGAILAQTTEVGLKSVYDQLLPNQGQGLFDALDAAAQAVSGMTGTTPDAGTRVAGSSLWLQEVNERVRRSGIQTQGSYSSLLGLAGGYEHMGSGGGAVGVTLAYFNAEEADAGAQVGSKVVASMLEAGAYYRRAVGGLTVSVRGAGGYSWFSGERRFLAPGATATALSSWGGYFFDGHAGAAYERHFGRFYARPEVSVDYLGLHESAHDETGGGDGFNLNVAARASSRLSGQAILVLGTQWGKAAWLRSEIRGGYREIFSGSVGDTMASFVGGDPFNLAADKDNGGWATIGFSLKGGSQYSYLALEGDADFRSGEQRYDVRLAGRSMF
jgi:hypothetical protein